MSISTPSWPTLQNGSTGDRVGALQHLLNYRNGTNINANGIFDSTTAAGVLTFKTNNSLPKDSVADANTLIKLVASASLTNTNAVKAAQTLIKQF